MTYEERVYSTCIADGMPRPLALLITAQSKHESGNYTSSIFRDCNNSFGYKVYGNARSCPGHPDYEAYNNIEDSTHEITAWIKRRLNEGNFPPLQTITDPYQYAQLLKNNGYYGDTVNNYASALVRWYDSALTSFGNTGLILAGLVLLLIIKRRV